jgi:hypothetical protein
VPTWPSQLHRQPFDGTIDADARDVWLRMRDVLLMHVEDGSIKPIDDVCGPAEGR